MADHRRFYLQRDTDVTGASGIGRVADGVLWPDGTVSVHWDRLEDAEAVHGHGGATRIVWIDSQVETVELRIPVTAEMLDDPDLGKAAVDGIEGRIVGTPRFQRRIDEGDVQVFVFHVDVDDG